MSTAQELDRLMQLAMERIEDGPERRALLAKPLDDVSDLPAELLGADGPEDASDAKPLKISEMKMAQKIKLAMFGNKTARTTLLRDPNRMIQLFVLDNPRISENELADLAKSTSVDEAVLRELANHGEWMRDYYMKLTIVMNPKTPVDVSLKWFKFLSDKDLITLSRSKNIPQVISSSARKLVDKRTKKKGGGE